MSAYAEAVERRNDLRLQREALLEQHRIALANLDRHIGAQQAVIDVAEAGGPAEAFVVAREVLAIRWARTREPLDRGTDRTGPRPMVATVQRQFDSAIEDVQAGCPAMRREYFGVRLRTEARIDLVLDRSAKPQGRADRRAAHRLRPVAQGPAREPGAAAVTNDVMNPVGCRADECTTAAEVKALCRKHYQRMRKTGTTTRRDALDRFMAKVEISDDGCWIWTGYLNPAGYGQFGVGSRLVLAHRWLYEQAVEQIPDSLTLDHLCRVTACVNPDHLEPVSLAENIRRAAAVRDYGQPMAVCAHGHAMTPANSYRRPGRRNSLACKTCQREASRRYTARKKGLAA